MSYELELELDDTSGWIGNACYYATREEALRAGLTISKNSMRVRRMRVVECPHLPVRHRWNMTTGRTERLPIPFSALSGAA